MQEVISKGSFGVVYRAVRRRDGAVFALKQVRLKGMKKVERQEALDEARTLAQLRHPHVVRHYGTFIDSEERLNIVMEYAASGSLGGVLKAAKGGGLPEARVWRYLVQSLLGLAYIHSKKIIHRDIKPQNLFLDAADNVKIGDLGIARNLSDGSDFAHTLVGTPYYLSPELCDDRPYNEKSDIWALGVVMVRHAGDGGGGAGWKGVGAFAERGNTDGSQAGSWQQAVILKVRLQHVRQPSTPGIRSWKQVAA